MGRPNKLEPDVKNKLMASLSMGLAFKRCCDMSGITYRTFRNWMNRGEEAKSGQYFQFFHEVKKAQTVGIAAKIKEINLDPAWQAKAWLLERQYPEEFGRKDKVDLSSKGEKITGITLEVVEAVRPETKEEKPEDESKN